MKERPIIFSGPMVRAILDGRKSQTRRVIKPQPKHQSLGYMAADGGAIQCGTDYPDVDEDFVKCPYGKSGSTLWVRENGWQPPEITDRMLREGADTWPKYIYDADSPSEADWCKRHWWKRRPSIHMPRWASRITLELTGVRVERVGNISEEDAIAEGIEHTGDRIQDGAKCFGAVSVVGEFKQLWHKIHAADGPNGWTANPWLWVIAFRKIAP